MYQNDRVKILYRLVYKTPCFLGFFFDFPEGVFPGDRFWEGVSLRVSFDIVPLPLLLPPLRPRRGTVPRKTPSAYYLRIDFSGFMGFKGNSAPDVDFKTFILLNFKTEDFHLETGETLLN